MSETHGSEFVNTAILFLIYGIDHGGQTTRAVRGAPPAGRRHRLSRNARREPPEIGWFLPTAGFRTNAAGFGRILRDGKGIPGTGGPLPEAPPCPPLDGTVAPRLRHVARLRFKRERAGALAQSRLGVGAIRVDVAPLRASAGEPTATWVEQELPRQLAQALSGRQTPKGAALMVRVELSHSRAEQGQPGLGQHQRRRDGRGRCAASAGDIEILGLGDRSGDDRAIQSCPCFGRRAGAGVLDRARSLIRNPLDRFASLSFPADRRSEPGISGVPDAGGRHRGFPIGCFAAVGNDRK